MANGRGSGALRQTIRNTSLLFMPVVKVLSEPSISSPTSCPSYAARPGRLSVVLHPTKQSDTMAIALSYPVNGRTVHTAAPIACRYGHRQLSSHLSSRLSSHIYTVVYMIQKKSSITKNDKPSNDRAPRYPA